MKYLVVLHEWFEGDNNTPSDKIWAKITEIKNDHERIKAEKVYLDEFSEDGALDISVKFIPLVAIDEEWEKVEEIW